ncbi:hypothetical protein [Neorhizobium galegae]|uniref:hypothetical protein n=1 Tax=Neorhizobium galegae TaxID=399 RepID=UPI000A867D00|nr:hypothetical protein [Neorhizobium galegae]
MSQYTMIVIGNKNLVSSSTRDAWERAGIELQGPVLPPAFEMRLVHAAHGVLIDATEDADPMFRISEQLEAASVPFLFVVTEQQGPECKGSYVLGPKPKHIKEIVEELLRQYDSGVRH